MRVESHATIAVITWACVTLRQPNWIVGTTPSDFGGVMTLLVGVRGIGALAPDLDHPQSSLMRSLGPAKRLARGVLPHRGILHSVFAVAVIRYLGLTVFQLDELARAFAWGYASHILGDILTVSGVPILAPLSDSRFGLPEPLAIVTGGFGDALYTALIAAASVLWATHVI
jgi:inner membrane protein